MKAILKHSITFKDGETWTPGQTIIITINQDRPTVAQLISNINTDYGNYGNYKKVRSAHLYKWFNEFIKFNMDDLEEAVCDGSCPSLTGDNVEPDGWDCKGMPSILLAAGIM